MVIQLDAGTYIGGAVEGSMNALASEEEVSNQVVNQYQKIHKILIAVIKMQYKLNIPTRIKMEKHSLLLCSIMNFTVFIFHI